MGVSGSDVKADIVSGRVENTVVISELPFSILAESMVPATSHSYRRMSWPFSAPCSHQDDQIAATTSKAHLIPFP